MNRSLRAAVPLFILLLLFSITALAQSIPLATLSGRVTSEGAVLPGVTVTVTSPNMRNALDGDAVTGAYTFRWFHRHVHREFGFRSLSRQLSLPPPDR